MKRFKVLWIILACILVLIGGGIGFAYYWIDSTLGKMELTEKIDKEEAGIEEGLIHRLLILRYLVLIKMVMKQTDVVMR